MHAATENEGENDGGNIIFSIADVTILFRYITVNYIKGKYTFLQISFALKSQIAGKVLSQPPIASSYFEHCQQRTQDKKAILTCPR